MKRRAAIAQYEATVVLVVISLALASVVYSGLRRESSLDPEPVFVNAETPIGGGLERVSANSSSATTITSMSVDAASSGTGVLALGASGYSTSGTLCAPGETTFFSVMASQPGTLEIATNGVAWVDGTWADAVGVSAGWQEVMIQGGSSCSITVPGGQAVSSVWSAGSPLVSSIPMEGSLSGVSFTFYVPAGTGSPDLLLTSTGGFDELAL